MLKVLVVDDEAGIRKMLSLCLESRGHTVKGVSNIKDALAEADRQIYDTAFIDLRLGTDNGMELVPAFLKTCPWMKIVVITAYATVDTAVQAMRLGAADYLPKPFTPEQVDIVTERISSVRRMEDDISRLKDDLAKLRPETSFSTNNPAMKLVLDTAKQVAPTDATILIRGENGTGKTILAKAIHSWSKRSGKPIAVVSCPSLSAELLESELFGHIKGAFTGAVRDNAGRIASCEGGTLFLDEIGELPLSIQPKLLRFIQDREYERVGDQKTKHADVRIISATNANLEEAVKQGLFREDLYYRLNVIQLDMPSLAERTEDIIPLALDILRFFGAQNHRIFKGFSPEAEKLLKSCKWRGNLREMRNVIERAAIMCRTETVGAEYFPFHERKQNHDITIGDKVSLNTVEEKHIRGVISACTSLQEAADVLGIDQATLWRKRKQYGI
ncbi:sigma-54 dependent transcriptional regulator [Seleniivibrio woodruffii]|uniref:sigma-54-dependent transcriptional regulator n=1 Tax=Seleniivibrio woodruffii TaxID=1078050 RepID=UPI0026F0F184|nr:sigma-54 dependent transcriptional regulator [Seleniivibrio woodruffii]